MAYKRYIKRGKNIYGPYVYHSRKEGGKVISEYRGKYKKYNRKSLIFFIIGLLALSFIVILIQRTDLQDSITGLILSEVQQDQSDETQIVLGKPVKWKKYLSVDSPDSFKIKIPEEAEKIRVKKLDTENIILSFIENLALTGRVIDNENSEIILDEVGEYEINYETPAPYAVEEDLERGKRVKIVGPETIHYENVLSFTELDENLNIVDPSSVRIHWLEEDKYVPIETLEDTNNNGIYDYIEWFTPYLSNQTLELDDIWSEEIPDGNYIRVTFEENLTNDNDITIYPRTVTGNPRVEVYEKDGGELIAEFTSLNSDEYNKILLTNLVGEQDSFDLRVVGGSIKIEHVIDPSVPVIELYTEQWDTSGSTSLVFSKPTEVQVGELLLIIAVNDDTSATAFTDAGKPSGWNFIVDFGDTASDSHVGLFWKIADGTEGSSETVTSEGGDEWGGWYVRISGVDTSNPINAVGTATTAAGSSITASAVTTDVDNCLALSFGAFDGGDGYPFTVSGTDWSKEDDGQSGADGNSDASGVWGKKSMGSAGSTLDASIGASASDGMVGAQIAIAPTPEPDTESPKWQNPSVNDSTPNPTDTVRHNINWTDNNALNFATLEINSTGAGCNTADNVSSTILSGASSWANLSWQVPNECEGKTIGWKQYANDTGSPSNWNVTDLQTYTVEDIDPTAAFGTNPADLNESSSQSIIFELSCSDNLNVDYLILYGNWTGTWHANQTNATPINGTTWSIQVDDLPEGISHTWSVWCNDTLGNEDWEDNRTFTVDVTAPTATINTANNTNTTDNTPGINITLTDNIGSTINYTFYINDTANKTGAVANDTATNITMDALSDSLYRIKVQATDNASNSANSSEIWITIDTTAPQFSDDADDSGGSVVEEVIVNISVYWQDSAVVLDTAIFRHNASSSWANVSTCSLSGTSNWCNKTIDTTGDAGEYICWNQYANDTLGNLNISMSQTAHCFSVTAANVAPYSLVINDIDGNSNNSYTTDTEPEINFTVIDREQSSLSCELWVNGSAGYGNDSSVSNNTATILSINQTLTDGFYTTYVNCSDGSLTNSSNSWWFTADTQNPSINLNLPGDNFNTSSQTTDFNFTATDNISPTMNCSLYINDTYEQSNASTNNNTLTNLQETGIVEGSHNWTIKCKDLAENEGTSATRDFYIDLTDPTDNDPTDESYLQDSGATIDWILTDDYASSYYYVERNETLQNSSTAWQNNTNLGVWVNTTTLGVWNYTIFYNDSVGNSNSDEVMITISSDNAPSVTLNSPIDDISLENVSLYGNWTGSWLLNETNDTPVNNAPVIFDKTIADGIYVWNCKACDSISQCSFDSANYTFTVDVTAPTVTLPVYTNATEKKSSDDLTLNISVSDTTTNPESCSVYIAGQSSNQTITYSNGWCNTTTFSLTNANEGNSTIYVYANDTVGNWGLNDSYVVWIDDTAPTVTLPVYTNATQYRDDQSMIFNISVSDTGVGADDCSINVAGNANQTVAVSNGWCNGTYVLTGIGDGNQTINAYANDTLGNTGLNDSYVVWIDSTAPIITVVSPLNQTYDTISILFNITATDGGGISACWYSLNSGATNTSLTGSGDYYTDTNFSMTQGPHTVNYYCNDSSNNLNDTEQETFFIDSVYPLISFTTGTEDNDTTFARDWIFANVTVIEDNEDTITFFLYNQTSIVNQTSYTTTVRTINWTSLPNEIYYYNVTVNDTAGNSNSTETREIVLDIEGPQVTSLTESPADPADYSEGGNYRFNATVTDPSLDMVWVDFNGTNYTATNFAGNIYNITLLDLGVETYDYRWYANDSFGNLNDSENGTYTIDQATPSLSLTITPSTSETYGTETTANGTNCPSQLTCNLYRDSVSVSKPETITLAVGTYNYTYNTTGNTNYTSYTNTTNLTVSKATGVVYTYLNNSRANKTIEQYTEIYLNATLETGAGTIKLYNNETLINQGSSPLSNLTNFTSIYLYNITAIYDGNENYTSDSETWWVNATEADVTSPQINLTYPLNRSYASVQTQLNYTATDNIGLNTCWYSTDDGATNTTITCGNNVTGLDSGQGSSTWLVYANDSKGNDNSSSVTFFVDSISPTISFTSPTKESGESIKENYIEINTTANDTNLDKIVIRLYNSTHTQIDSAITSSSPNFENFTSLSDGLYYFNATANDTAGNNISTETRNISLVLPELTIIKPENETYIHTNNLLLNYTADYEDYVWYNINLTGDNETITGNTTFDVSSQGSHTLYLYANNSNGETAKNVTFSVDINKFAVIYDEFKDEGESTDFNQSSYEDLQNLSNVVLENTDYGKIQFNEAINVTNDANVSDNEIDLDTHTNISDNRIEINSTALPNFNTSATLYLYNLTLSSPVRILRDGSVCSSAICTQQSYTGGTLIFNVTQFTVYSAEETPAAEEPSEEEARPAGRGVECTEDSQCTGNEVCLNFNCVKLFDVKIIDFESPVKLGEFFDFTYFIKGMSGIGDDVEINFWIEKSGTIITSGSETIYLGNFEEREETTKLFLPSIVESGIYEFIIEVNYVNYPYSARSHRTIEVIIEGDVAEIVFIDEKIQGSIIILALIILLIIVFFVIFYKKRRSYLENKKFGLEKELLKTEPIPEQERIEYIEKPSHLEILRNILYKNLKSQFILLKFLLRKPLDFFRSRYLGESSNIIERAHEDVFRRLNKLLRWKSKKKLIETFEKDLVKTGKFTVHHLKTLRDIFDARSDLKKDKAFFPYKIKGIRKKSKALVKDLDKYLKKIRAEKRKEKIKRIKKFFVRKKKRPTDTIENIVKGESAEIQKTTFPTLPKQSVQEPKQVQKIKKPKIVVEKPKEIVKEKSTIKPEKSVAELIAEARGEPLEKPTKEELKPIEEKKEPRDIIEDMVEKERKKSEK